MQPFETCGYEEQLYRLQHLVTEILPSYNLQGSSVSLLQYEDNAVYRITSCIGEHFVLRISAADGHSPAVQRSEMQWLMALQYERDVRVPEPVANRDGDFVTIGTMKDMPEPRTCVLLRWVPGEPPSPEIEPAMVESIGIFTARLHGHAEQFVLPPGFVRPSWDWERLFGAGSVLRFPDVLSSLLPYQHEILSHVSFQVQQSWPRLQDDGSSWRLIHGDLHRDNILLYQGRVGVIDFDDCGWGSPFLDLAAVLDSFFRRVVRHPQDYPSLREAYLKGYDRIRPLPADLDARLKVAKVMRDMVNVNFILASKNASVQTWGQQRLSQIFRDLEAYLDGSFVPGL